MNVDVRSRVRLACAVGVGTAFVAGVTPLAIALHDAKRVSPVFAFQLRAPALEGVGCGNGLMAFAEATVFFVSLSILVAIAAFTAESLKERHRLGLLATTALAVTTPFVLVPLWIPQLYFMRAAWLTASYRDAVAGAHEGLAVLHWNAQPILGIVATCAVALGAAFVGPDYRTSTRVWVRSVFLGVSAALMCGLVACFTNQEPLRAGFLGAALTVSNSVALWLATPPSSIEGQEHAFIA